MNIKKNIIRIGMVALWMLSLSGLLILSIAAVERKDNKRCKAVEIKITGDGEVYFLEKKEVMAIIAPDDQSPAGRPLSSLELKKAEATLEKNIWVKKAELFVDNNQVLHVNIEERVPVARIFTVRGNSFFIDSSGKKLPLSDQVSVKLPVFTGFTGERTTGLDATGKKLVDDIRTLGVYLMNNKFWMAQIAQVDIINGRYFEMIPTVGNHVIEFGDGSAIDDKFNRLLVFYRQVSAGTGFDKYSRLDLRYQSQVVATHKGTISRVDSIQAMKNIERLIIAASRLPEDSNLLNENIKSQSNEYE